MDKVRLGRPEQLAYCVVSRIVGLEPSSRSTTWSKKCQNRISKCRGEPHLCDGDSILEVCSRKCRVCISRFSRIKLIYVLYLKCQSCHHKDPGPLTLEFPEKPSAYKRILSLILNKTRHELPVVQGQKQFVVQKNSS